MNTCVSCGQHVPSLDEKLEKAKRKMLKALCDAVSYVTILIAGLLLMKEVSPAVGLAGIVGMSLLEAIRETLRDIWEQGKELVKHE